MSPGNSYERCAVRLKALADPERLRIIECLFEGAKSVGQLCEQLNDDIVKVSHHLRVLRTAGFAQCERRGRNVIYSLPADVFDRAAKVGDLRYIDLGCCRLELPSQM